jgi:hypothetical protein
MQYTLRMRPHPRIRKTIKWGGATVTLLLVVLWIGSNWWAFQFHPTSHTCVATGGVGEIIVAWIGPPLMSEAEWNILPGFSAGARSQTYEEFHQSSPFALGYFRRTNRPGAYNPPPVWIWPWASDFGNGEQLTSRFIFKREMSLPALRGYSRANPYWRCCVLVWPLALACGAVTALAWCCHLLFFWRARQGLCRTCKYDRTGLPAGAVCPECGEPSVPS